MKRSFFFSIIILLLSATFASAFTNSFESYSVFPYKTPTIYSNSAVAVGDINSDGKNEVVLTRSTLGVLFDPLDDQLLLVYETSEFGHLRPPVSYPVHSINGQGADSVAIGDVNDDGKPDVVIGVSGVGIEVYLQGNSGDLLPSQVYPTIHSNKIRLGDLNKDGKTDIVGIGTDNMIEIWFQSADGFNNPPYSITLDYLCGHDLDLGDVNSDGLTDIVLTLIKTNPSIAVITQTVDHSFGPATYYGLADDLMVPPQGIAVGDIDHNGRNDIVVTTGGNRPYSKLFILYQDEAGTLKPAVSLASYDAPGPVEIADLNQDGLQDIFVLHDGWEYMSVHLQNNDGTLSTPEFYGVGSHNYFGNPQSLAIADINGDGLVDAVMSHTYSGLLLLIHRDAVQDIFVTPNPLRFTSLQPTSKELSVANTGSNPLTLGSIGVYGRDASHFAVANDSCSGLVLPPWTACSVKISFTQTSPGAREAYLQILSNDPDSPSSKISLFGDPQSSDSFWPYVQIPFPSDNWFSLDEAAVAVGDVNSDGKNEVALVTPRYRDADNKFSLYIYSQNESGLLDPPVSYLTQGTNNYPPGTIAIGDVNGDGKNDVLVGNRDASFEVFLQDATGKLTTSTIYPTPHASKIVIGDFNHDGLQDVATIGWGISDSLESGMDTDIDLFYQNSSGTLDDPVTYYASHTGRDEIEAADINNDGLTDIVVMSGGKLPNIGSLIQSNDGTFRDPYYYSLPYLVATTSLAIGDVNGDQLSDVIVTSGVNLPGSVSAIGVFHQNPSGFLEAPVIYDSYTEPASAMVADIGQDGRNDILLVHDGLVKGMGIYRQKADGSLFPEEFYQIPGFTQNTAPQAIAVGDINGDGLNDVVVASGSKLTLFHQKNPFLQIYLSDREIDFGKSPTFSVNTRFFRITNAGNTALSIYDITLGGVDSSDFLGDTTACIGRDLAPDNYCDIQVVFAPKSDGVKSAFLSIFSSDAIAPAVTAGLRGEATPDSVRDFRYLFEIQMSGSGQGTVSASAANGSGFSCKQNCEMHVQPSELNADQLVLTARASLGYLFAGWSGACTGTQSTCIVDTNGSKFIVARFVRPDLVGNLSRTSVKRKKSTYRLTTYLTLSSGAMTMSGIKAKVFLSDDAILDENDVLLTSPALSYKSLYNNKPKTLRLKKSFKVNPSGKYLIAVLDTSDIVNEEDEDNNILFQLIP